MTANNPPEWIRQVPLKTVGVLAAIHIFGKNVESRQILLSGQRYFHNAVENVVGYVLNPILPDVGAGAAGPGAVAAMRHVRDCFNFIFHIQVEYFKVLARLMPERFRSKSGVELRLNHFMAKGPTLLNSEKRYLILSKIDGTQPFDLNLDWNAEFDWICEDIRRLFHSRLILAQRAYAEALYLGEWYSSRDKNLVMPLKTIMDDLSEYFDHLGFAGYLMARKSDRRSPETAAAIKESLLATCRHLERFIINMLRVNVFSAVMHDLDRLGKDTVEAAVGVRADEDGFAGQSGFLLRRGAYVDVLERIYQDIGFTNPAGI